MALKDLVIDRPEVRAMKIVEKYSLWQWEAEELIRDIAEAIRDEVRVHGQITTGKGNAAAKD